MAWSKRSRHERGYGSEWDKLRVAALERDKHLCQPCRAKGRVTPATEVDHVLRKRDGGTDDMTNLQSICSPCHTAKTAAENGGRPKPAITAEGWPAGCT